MNVEEAIEKNQEASFYIQGKQPQIIKATIEFLQAWVNEDPTITITDLAEKYSCVPQTISTNAHALADILGIERGQVAFTDKKTFYRYKKNPMSLKIQCPKCKQTFHVTSTGRVLDSGEG